MISFEFDFSRKNVWGLAVLVIVLGAQNSHAQFADVESDPCAPSFKGGSFYGVRELRFSADRSDPKDFYVYYNTVNHSAENDKDGIRVEAEEKLYPMKLTCKKGNNWFFQLDVDFLNGKSSTYLMEYDVDRVRDRIVIREAQGGLFWFSPPACEGLGLYYFASKSGKKIRAKVKQNALESFLSFPHWVKLLTCSSDGTLEMFVRKSENGGDRWVSDSKATYNRETREITYEGEIYKQTKEHFH